jgi:hypothetical protein
MLPRALAVGIPGAAQVDIETPEARPRNEALANGSALPAPTWLGVSART